MSKKDFLISALVIIIILLIALLFVSIPGGEEFKKLAKINII